jgi:2-oxoglutarate/2-oxoacid ferredoxin oxidoreductase subunit alpha
LQHSNEEALNNTRRLEEKPLRHLPGYLYYDLNYQEGANSIIVSYGITAAAARDAVRTIRAEGKKVSLLIVKTILPVPPVYLDILGSYQKVIIAEENINNQFASVLYGSRLPGFVRTVTAIGKMISPDEIIKQEGAS